MKKKTVPAKQNQALTPTTSRVAGYAPTLPSLEFHWEPGSDPKTPEALQRYFNSMQLRGVKEHIIETGLRMWQRSHVDGNGGNITVRVGDNLVLCTPTLISKGRLAIDDIALVDLDGNQLAGRYKRTSEVNTHLACMRATPDAKACVHAHPPHATAFAVAHMAPPSAMCSEAEVFLGEIGITRYATPGTAENARLVGEIAADHPVILLQNHGVMAWGTDLEMAYWRLENLEAACKTIWIASQLGNGLHPIPPAMMRELITLRGSLQMKDKRATLPDSELCRSTMTPGFKGLVTDESDVAYTKNPVNKTSKKETSSGLSKKDIDAIAQRVVELLEAKKR
jgi:L-fuculose-phosphate aldolase